MYFLQEVVLLQVCVDVAVGLLPCDAGRAVGGGRGGHPGGRGRGPRAPDAGVHVLRLPAPPAWYDLAAAGWLH